MDNLVLDLIVAIIPILGAIITRYVVPFIKAKISAAELETAKLWVHEAVLAAEVLFKENGSGNEKRDFVIDFIDKKVNKDKEVITKEQIRVLLEAAWKESIAVVKEVEE